MPDRADPITQRILREAGAGEDLLDVLAERLSPTDLQSLLLEVYRRRSARVAPRDLVAQWASNRFVKPSAVPPAHFLEFDLLAFATLPQGFEALELSPVAPLGANGAIATVDQHKVVTTVRNSEVTADPTNVLALEAARRRKGSKSDWVRLCASHRTLRAQALVEAHHVAHFRLLGLVTAGRDRGSYRFECEALLEQIDFHLRLLAGARERLGYRVGKVDVGITELGRGRLEPALESGVLEPLRARHPQVSVRFAPERERGRGYYRDVCFEIRVHHADGGDFNLIDGGVTDWTQKLLSNRKERFLISGLGSELFVQLFRAPS